MATVTDVLPDLSPDLGGLTAAAVYAVVLGFVFVESGLLVGFFLPGDTILFGAGLVSAEPGSGVSGACASEASIAASWIRLPRGNAGAMESPATTTAPPTCDHAARPISVTSADSHASDRSRRAHRVARITIE